MLALGVLFSAVETPPLVDLVDDKSNPPFLHSFADILVVVFFLEHLVLELVDLVVGFLCEEGRNEGFVSVFDPQSELALGNDVVPRNHYWLVEGFLAALDVNVRFEKIIADLFALNWVADFFQVNDQVIEI